MAEPHRFDTMINYAFVWICVLVLTSNANSDDFYQTAAMIIYAVIGGSGYLMFGDTVSDEAS